MKKKKRVPDDMRVAELGDETGDWSSPRPDSNVVDEEGEEIGVEFQEEEPLRPIEKVSERDRNRWELDPASDPDYPERAQADIEPDED